VAKADRRLANPDPVLREELAAVVASLAAAVPDLETTLV
jgi:hypothetical protein